MNLLHPSVTELLARLRLRIRAHVVFETVALLVLLLSALFWLALLFDWYFEPPRAVRLVGWLLALGAAGGVVVWWGVRRLLVPLDDARLAVLLEQHVPELQDRLSTAVELAAPESTALGTNSELIARLHRQAADAAEGFREQTIFNRRRLGGLGLACVVAGASIVTLAVFAPQTWSVITRRLALDDLRWPRSVELTIAGFNRDAQGRLVRKVARNDDIELEVGARLSTELRDPRHVRINYRWATGGRGRDELVRVGDAATSGNSQQDYSYVFERIGDSVEFDLRGGDGRLGPLWLEVVDRPKVLELTINATYPQYLGRPDATLAAGTRIELPEGTVAQVNGRASKTLASVTVTRASGAGVEARVDGNEFRIDLATLSEDAPLRLQLVDTDGIASREPFVLTIAAHRDELPQVAARRAGIGTGVTAIAQIPLEATISDDNRLVEVWADLTVVDGTTKRITLSSDRALAATYESTPVFDLRSLRSAGEELPLSIADGDVLNVLVQARDAFDLGGASHVGAARPLQFEIISEGELLARLARSELNFRQTFESIADKLIVLLDEVERAGRVPASVDEAAATATADPLQVVQTSATTPADAEATALRVARMTEDAAQLSTETLAIADGFMDLYRQLENNRVENQELRSRIGERIAKPLVALGEQRLQEVSTLLRTVTAEPASFVAPRESVALAVREAEQILREMQGLENYNEVIAMLREIIDKQDELSEKTKTRERDQLRSLLE